MESVCDVLSTWWKAYKVSGHHTFGSVHFLLLSMSDLCIYFWRIHICLAEHEYKHDSKKRLTCGSFQCSATDWHPLLSPAFLRSPAKEALMGVWRPVSGVLAKFTSHLESSELGGNWGFACPSGTPPPPGPGVPCGSPCPTNTWEINQTHCWQPLTVKQEDGELHEKSGIYDRYFHDWGKKIRFGGGAFFFFFFEGKTVCSLNTLRLNEKFPHVLNIWKVSLLAVDKRQSYAASGSNVDDTLRSIFVFVWCSESFTENNSPSPLPALLTLHVHNLSHCLRYAIFNGKAIDRVVWS